MSTATGPEATSPPRPGSPGAPGPHPRRTGSLLGILALLALLAVAAVLSIAIGSRTISVGTTLRVLFSPDDSGDSTIIHGLRVPRTALAIMIGVALGMAGTLMQGHTRNALADPGLLGVSAGASFAVVLAIYLLGITSPAGYVWFALVGSGLAATAVFAIGSTRGGPNPVTLVLAGSAVTALLSSLTYAVVTTDATTLNAYRFWVVGSVTGRDTDVAVQVAPFLLLGVLLAAMSTPTLNLLQLGEDVATALGVHPVRHRVMGLGAVMLLSGAATAACGPITFVGLIVPHLARFLAGVDYRWVLPYAGLLGGLVVTLADVLGRLVVRPGELQVGIVMALVGGPAFVLLVRRARMLRL